MACIANLSPSHRPPQPSLNNGPVQRRVRREFVATGQSVLSTTQIITNRHHARRSVRRVCERYCERVGRGSASGRPILWRLPEIGIRLPETKATKPLLDYKARLLERESIQASFSEQEREMRT